jgi:hypothetical protein
MFGAASGVRRVKREASKMPQPSTTCARAHARVVSCAGVQHALVIGRLGNGCADALIGSDAADVMPSDGARDG